MTTEKRLDALTAKAIALLRASDPTADGGDPYYGCFSGGKDSVVIKQLALEAGVACQWHYNNTTIDPPELLRFIKAYHPDVTWVPPKHGNFFHRAAQKGFPTRRARWCCQEYKEGQTPAGRVAIFGVRAQESPRRAKSWKPTTMHTRTHSWVVSPILRWTEDDVWAFIHSRALPYCSLYDEGFKRLGCIGCPMAREASRRREFARWPKYEAAWRRMFHRVWARRSGSLQRNGKVWFGDVYFRNADEMFEWWLSDYGPKHPRGGLQPVAAAAATPGSDDDADDDEEESCQVALDMNSGAEGPEEDDNA